MQSFFNVDCVFWIHNSFRREQKVRYTFCSKEKIRSIRRQTESIDRQMADCRQKDLNRNHCKMYSKPVIKQG